jgi:branched-chain amino acid transport system ATP-binding protein
MPFTLLMTSWWLLAAAALGGLIGWLWNRGSRGKNTTDLQTAGAGSNTAEADKLRHRIANLEPAVAERDQLKAQVGRLEADLKAANSKPAAPAAVATLAGGIGQSDHDAIVNERDQYKLQVAKLDADLKAAAGKPVGVAQAEHDLIVGERNRHAARISQLEADLASCQAARKDDDVKIQGFMAAVAPPTPDNLQLIVGVGPVIEKVLNDGGVFTFDQMVAAGTTGIQDILPDMQDARVVKEDWMGQAEKFLDAKRRGVDPASVSRDDQIK